MAAIKAALAEHRLITLTGVGGCGKSRLALEVAADLLDRFADGVWLVELEGLTDPPLVPQAVAAVLGVHEEPGQPLLETIAAALTGRRMLLVLDNCEHLAQACAELAQTLLHRVPELHLLTTAREPLRVPGEVVRAVPPLAVPSPEHVADLTDLARVEAIALFLDRARARQADFDLTPDNASSVADICRCLDGLPLAIELAAARLGALPVETLAAHLDSSIEVLRSGWRVPPRHASLRAALDWSYERLSPAEQCLVARLSVFAGSFSLDSVQAVCSGQDLDRTVVLGLLPALVEKSLVVGPVQKSPVRYRLLEPVRQYAQEVLAARHETSLLQRAHLRFFTAWAEEAAPSLAGPEQREWIERVRQDEENLRVALRRASADPNSALLGLRLASGIARFWLVTCQWSEGRQWLDQLLAVTPPESAARPRALLWASALALLQGDFAAVRELAQQCIALASAAGDLAVAGEVGAILAIALANQGDARAGPTIETALERLRRQGEPAALGRALMGAGIVARLRGEPVRAVAAHRESAALLQAAGDRYFLAHTISNLGLALIQLDKYAEAEALFEEALSLRRKLGDRQGIAWSLKDLGDVARACGRGAIARARYLESLALLRAFGDRGTTAAVHAALQELAVDRRRGAAATDRSAQRGARTAGLLTPREREVIGLLARGYSNRRIAEALVITEGTAALHVQHILAKLGCSSRAEAAAWAVAHGLAAAPPDSSQ